ncbi:MAG: clostripain-related cysteine peptidase [Candidatus Micrarchaeia archaeon]
MNIRIAALFLLLLFFTGCCGITYEQLYHLISSNETQTGIDVFPTKAEWTYMVYMDGDNNLELAAIADFLEIEQGGGSSDKVNFVVQIDRSEGYFAGEGDWSGARRYLVGSGDGQTIHSQPVQELGKVDMGDPDTLYEFVSWAIDEYPAKKYALVVWNHGGGWTGMLMDDGVNSSMDMNEMRQALSRIKQKLGRKIDVIVFDMCLMGQYDVMLDTYEYADYMVASEEVVPGYSLDYSAVVSSLRANPSMTPKQLAVVEVEKFREFYAEKQHATTMAAYDLSKFPQLKNAFDEFAKELTKVVKSGKWKDVAEMHQYAEHYPMGAAEERVFSFGDLYDFASNAVSYSYNNNELVQKALALQEAVNSTVILNYNHPKHSRSYGVSYYFQPARWIYEKINANDYPKTTAYNQPAWREFLREYYARENITLTKPSISEFMVSPAASLVRPIRFSYTVFGSNLMKNQWLQFYYENGEWKLARLVGQRAVTKLPDGKVVYGISDGLSKGVGRSAPVEMRLSDGVKTVKASVDKRWPAEDFVVVMGLLQRGNDKADAQVYFYESNGSIAHVQVSVQGPDGKPVIGYLPYLEEGDVFTPYIFKLSQGSLTAEMSQPLTYSKKRGFEVSWHLLEPGTYMVADMLTDLAEQATYVIGSVKVEKQPTLTPLKEEDLKKNWECGQIEQGITIVYLASFNFSGGCVMEDGLGVSECELTYSNNAIPHLYVYMKDRFETLHFITSRINDSAMWLFELAGTDPIICVTAGSKPPSLDVYRTLYASVGDKAEDLEVREVNPEGMKGEWESEDGKMALKFNSDGTFRWMIGSNAITGSYTVNVSHVSLNAVAPSPEYSTVFRYFRSNRKLVLYDVTGSALVFSRKGVKLPQPSNTPAPAVAPGATQPQQTPYQPPTPPNELVGQWYNGYTNTLLVLDASGYYTLLDGYFYYYGTYTAQNGVLSLTYVGQTYQYKYTLSGNTLTLEGQGIRITLTRVS